MSNCSLQNADRIRDYLDESGIRYAFDEEQCAFFLTHSLKGKARFVWQRIDVHDDYFVSLVYFPVPGDAKDEKQMTELNRFVNLVNYRLYRCNIELDNGDGELRFKTCILCDEIELSDQLIRDAIAIPLITVSRYAQGLLEVILTDAPAAEAYGKCFDALRRDQRETSSDSDEEDAHHALLLRLLDALVRDDVQAGDGDIDVGDEDSESEFDPDEEAE